MTDEQPAESIEKEPRNRTERLVLYQDDNGAWVETDRYISTSQNAAISAHLSTLSPEEQEREWVAVPVRSWKPVPVGVETQTKLKFG